MPNLTTVILRSLCAMIFVLMLTIVFSSPVKSQIQIITDQDLKWVDSKSLEVHEGVPVLPLYSISQTIQITRQHKIRPQIRSANASPKVAIQVGHLAANDLPDELKHLRSTKPGEANGISELEINQQVARYVAKLLEAENIQVDILGSAVPPDYQADLFISLHADVKFKPTTNGFKIARSRYSVIPETDDQLMKILYANYAQTTKLVKDLNITSNMTGYYAFNNLKYYNSLNVATPAVIFEMGFLTNAAERLVLTTQQPLLAKGIANGILAFLQDPASKNVTPREFLPSLRVTGAAQKLLPIYSQSNPQELIAFVHSGQHFAYFEANTVPDHYQIWLPVVNKSGLLKKTMAQVV